MKKAKKNNNNRWLWLGAVILALIMVLAALELTGVTHFFHKQSIPAVIPTRNNSRNNSSSSAEQSPNNQNNGPGSQSTANTPAPTVDHSLIAPTGNFVSNHFPGQNGSPTTETSTCNTTAGASCYIMFSNVDSGQTTQLPTQITDSRGSTSWYWDVKQDAHLTSGRWKVTAVASLNGQQQSTNDALNLTIQ